MVKYDQGLFGNFIEKGHFSKLISTFGRKKSFLFLTKWNLLGSSIFFEHYFIGCNQRLKSWHPFLTVDPPNEVGPLDLNASTRDFQSLQEPVLIKVDLNDSSRIPYLFVMSVATTTTCSFYSILHLNLFSSARLDFSLSISYPCWVNRSELGVKLCRHLTLIDPCSTGENI